jgi:hypothetical protein
VLFVGVDVDATGGQVHRGDREVRALQPAAAAQGVGEGGGARVRSAVDGVVEELGLVSRCCGDRITKVLGRGIALAGALGDF